MPNDPPYGGRIEVAEDGSVLWQISAREYPRDRDTDGTMEYAIRVVDQDRSILASRDGKCLVNVHAEGTLFKAQMNPGRAKFLIVSGYDAPDTPQGTKLIGKSYYITGARPKTGAQNQRKPQTVATVSRSVSQPLPPYDLVLHYDDYDLNRAGLSGDDEPIKLRLCYQHWVSVRSIWKHYRAKVNVYQDAMTRAKGDIEPFLKRYELSKSELHILLVWSLTYHHLKRLRIPQAKLDSLRVILDEWNDEDDDIWLSRWKRVRKNDESVKYADDAGEMPGAMELISNLSGPLSAQTTPLPEKVMAADRYFGYGTIGDSDLTKQDDDGAPISGTEIVSEARSEVPGSRSIVVTKLTRPGTFVLMYHQDDHTTSTEGGHQVS